MAKIVIRNRVESEWQPVIEAKLQFMLGSMLAYTSRINIELDRDSQRQDKLATYVCKLLLVEDNGERYVHRTDQPDAELAIEGAIARARRAMLRRSRARTSGRRHASAQ
jgi:hypothetical protein